MRNYVLRRLLVAVPSLLIASLIVFTLPRLIPGDVVQLMLEEKAYGKDLEELRAKLGLNRPMHVQRAVEAQLGAQLLEVLRVLLFLQHERHHVAGDEPRQREDDQ